MHCEDFSLNGALVCCPKVTEFDPIFSLLSPPFADVLHQLLLLTCAKLNVAVATSDDDGGDANCDKHEEKN